MLYLRDYPKSLVQFHSKRAGLCCGNVMSPATIKRTSVYMWNARVQQNLIFWGADFHRGPNTKFHGNPPSGMRVVTFEQTDGHNTKRIELYATLGPYSQFISTRNVFSRFLPFPQQTEMISRLVCVMWRQRVFLEVQIEFLNIVNTSFRLHALCL